MEAAIKGNREAADRGTLPNLVPLVASCLFAMLWCGGVAAEKIRLKNGNTIEGQVTETDSEHVSILVSDFGTLTLGRSEIASVEASSEISSPGTSVQEDRRSQDVSSRPTEPPMAMFENRKRSVRLPYPAGWHVLETEANHPYVVTVEPTPPNPDMKVSAPVVIELFKFYHVSVTLAHSQPPQEILETYIQSALKGPHAELIEQSTVDVQGSQGRLVLLRAADSRSPARRLKMFILAAIRDDVLAAVFCQAPDEAFSKYQQVFEVVVKQVKPFSATGTRSDNEQLDSESGRLTGDALMALNAGNGRRAAELLDHAVTINPGDPSAHLNYGSLLMIAAQSQSDEAKEGLLRGSEQHLERAAELFQTSGGGEKTAPLVAQAYFLLGEISNFGRGDRKQAKAYYEQALQHYPHQGAKEALQHLEEQ